MQLAIYPEQLISEVQRDFSLAYPYLKIEFFKNGSVRKDRYHLQNLIAGSQKVKDAWYAKKEEGELEIVNSMTVLQLENAFMDRFGLSAQVFRNSGNIWLETTLTDNWTLKQQNDHGREISTHINKLIK